VRNDLDKSGRENQNTHFMFHKFSSENHAVYKIMWEKILHIPTGHVWQINRAHAFCMLDN